MHLTAYSQQLEDVKSALKLQLTAYSQQLEDVKSALKLDCSSQQLEDAADGEVVARVPGVG